MCLERPSALRNGSICARPRVPYRSKSCSERCRDVLGISAGAAPNDDCAARIRATFATLRSARQGPHVLRVCRRCCIVLLEHRFWARLHACASSLISACRGLESQSVVFFQQERRVIFGARGQRRLDEARGQGRHRSFALAISRSLVNREAVAEPRLHPNDAGNMSPKGAGGFHWRQQQHIVTL
jgi:hypothetical protein